MTPREDRGGPERDSGPPWPLLPPGRGAVTVSQLPHVFWSRGAASWYVGGGLAMLWLISVVSQVLARATSPGSATLGVALVVVFALGFLGAVPLGWSLPRPGRLTVVAVLFALSFCLFPWLSWGVRDVWTYVGVALGMMVVGWRITFPAILGLSLLAVLFGYLLDGWAEDDLWLPAIVFSISLMMAAFANTIAAMNELRATQDQLERLAVERERGRVARDIHDILGHSLTVITVKAELAGRLVDADPGRARAEIGEVETLARGALADVRATVSGVRGVNVSGELAAARAALSAAGIDAELPPSTEAVAPAHRELVGWIVREGVTNVVRHSGARRCVVRLDPHGIEIADDGIGPSPRSRTSTGLAGLRERVEAAGGGMTVGRSDLGGFSLRVTL